MVSRLVKLVELVVPNKRVQPLVKLVCLASHEIVSWNGLVKLVKPLVITTRVQLLVNS